VNSELFDHTSLIRFVEQRFGRQHPGIFETNITPWRRAVAGDLTSAFDFKTPNAAPVSLPNTDGYEPPDTDRHPDYVPALPASPSMPKQEPGVRPARAVPYAPSVLADIDVAHGTLSLRFENFGKSAAIFHVRPTNGAAPATYTVGAGAHLSETYALKASGQTSYDLAVHGPNGFFRSFRGSVARATDANLRVRPDCGFDLGIALELENLSSKHAKISVYDAYGKRTITQLVAPHRSMLWHWPLESSFGWYDLTVRVDADASFEQRLAGHVENGKDSMTDPALGA